MVKKLFVCRNCGYTFPDELSQFIEKKVQVYCELCGTPFSLEGIKFKDIKQISDSTSKPGTQKPEVKISTLPEIIKKFTKITSIPILILSIILLFTISEAFLGLAGILISLYDIIYISKKIKKGKLGDIVLDSCCFGILGCIIYGTGVLILIKGILILFYEAYNSKDQPLYNFGLNLKNSFNNFSTLGGFIIIIFSFHVILIIFLNREEIPAVLKVFLPIAIIILLLDLLYRKKIYNKQKFDTLDAIGIIFLGIVGTMFFAVGIFILLKGIVIFFLLFGKPPVIKETPIEKIPIQIPVEYRETKQMAQQKGFEEKFIEKETKERELVEKPLKEKVSPVKIVEQKDIKVEKEPAKGFELEIHDSLLPLKDEKDKKLVKEYFAKIFTLLSKDLRNQIKSLNIPKDERKQLLNELVFLSEEQQKKYLEAIIEVYKEIPIKFIERIRKLPNIKSEHLFKIAEQLKFMDFEEQEEYIQFLEKNA
jgi:hypothetical protein